MRRSTALFPLILLLMATISHRAEAQHVLPRGIALFQLGYLGYAEQSEAFDAKGLLTPLGSRFDKSFRGAELARGHGGADLKRLASELSRFETEHPGAAGLVDGLDLGTLRGEVRADVQATSLGFAFGITPRLTLFAGIPWIRAKVESKLALTGTNNAGAIKDRLGDLAYDELKSGLDRAAALDAKAVRASLEKDLGYASLDRWENEGVGDLRLGARTSVEGRLARKLRWSMPITATLTTPTGAVDDPDELTDFGFGKGYYGAGLAIEPQLALSRFFLLGELGYVKNLGARKRERLPLAGEELAAKERTYDLALDPGDDVRFGGGAGFRLGIVTTTLKGGVERHFTDRYSGQVSGNYSALSDGTDALAIYVEGSLSVMMLAPVPFWSTVTVRDTPRGVNVLASRSYELTLASFLKVR